MCCHPMGIHCGYWWKLQRACHWECLLHKLFITARHTGTGFIWSLFSVVSPWFLLPSPKNRTCEGTSDFSLHFLKDTRFSKVCGSSTEVAPNSCPMKAQWSENPGPVTEARLVLLLWMVWKNAAPVSREKHSISSCQEIYFFLPLNQVMLWSCVGWWDCYN